MFFQCNYCQNKFKSSIKLWKHIPSKPKASNWEWCFSVQLMPWKNIKLNHIRGLTEENIQLSKISPTGYFKSPIGDFFIQLVIGDLFSDSTLPDSALPDSYILNPQLDILSPIWYLRSPIGNNMPNWGYCLLVLY